MTRHYFRIDEHGFALGPACNIDDIDVPWIPYGLPPPEGDEVCAGCEAAVARGVRVANVIRKDVEPRVKLDSKGRQHIGTPCDHPKTFDELAPQLRAFMMARLGKAPENDDCVLCGWPVADHPRYLPPGRN
jgi:hypothetical protein